MYGVGRAARVLSNGVSWDGVRKDSCSGATGLFVGPYSGVPRLSRR
jgi:hypothetical protein